MRRRMPPIYYMSGWRAQSASASDSELCSTADDVLYSRLQTQAHMALDSGTP